MLGADQYDSVFQYPGDVVLLEDQISIPLVAPALWLNLTEDLFCVFVIE